MWIPRTIREKNSDAANGASPANYAALLFAYRPAITPWRARIELPYPLEPMKKLDLIFDEHEQRLRCTVRWCSGNHVGVSFDGAPYLVPPRAA